MAGTLRFAIHDTVAQHVYPYTVDTVSAEEADSIRERVDILMDLASIHGMSCCGMQLKTEVIQIQVPKQYRVAWEYIP